MKYISKLPLILLCCFLISCGGDKPATSGDLRPANGGKYYGGVFKYNEEDLLRHLFPLNIRGTIGHRISLNLYEGLINLTQDNLNVIPALAESWTISDDGKVYTFKIRKGVFFHDDPCFPDGKGREVTAKDFKYCMDLLCTSMDNNAGDWLFKDKVLGATAHLEATKKGETPIDGVKGVKALDDNTLEITLENPFPDFMVLLSTPFTYVFPKEAYEKYGIKGMRNYAVGTGPFKIKKVVENEVILMLRNENYWGKDKDGNQLPYLDGVRVSFIKEQKSALLEFKKGNLDMVYRLPYEMVDEIMDENQQLKPDYQKYQLQMTSNLSIEYYGFQNQTEPFNNKKLRQAFCYAIDRKKITDFVVKKMAAPNFAGVIPMAFKDISGYDYSQLKGYNYDPDKARKLLAEAGYPNGKGLGKVTLQINSGGGKNASVAEAIQQQLEETLNIEVEILQLLFPQHYENIETAKTNFWRAGWVADYVSPENFLRLFYGPEAPAKITEKTYLNTIRFKNSEYDKLFDKAMSTMDKAQRHELYRQAEQILLDEAAVLPLFNTRDVRLIQPDVKNFPQNAMEFRYFTDVYKTPE